MDETVERVAQAMEDVGEIDLTLCAEAAVAALRPGDRVGPDGSLVVVPTEPTHLMRTEGNSAFEDAGTQWNGRKEVPEWDASVKAWHAMIAVAKEPSP